MLKSKLLIKLLIILPLFVQLTKVECKHETKKGRGKAFGAGILAGGLAGAAMGHILTRANSPAEVHHHHHFAETNAVPSNINVPATTPQIVPPTPRPLPRPSITIERGETLANGCYKQIVKEPNEYDAMSFFETERLICPPHVYLPIVPAKSIAQIQPADITGSVAESKAVQPPQVPAAIPTNNADTNVNVAESNPALPPQTPASLPTNMKPGYNVPPQPPRFNHSLEPLLPQPLPQPGPVVPITPGGLSNPPLPVQVITLSKKTRYYEDENKKKNSANNVLAAKFIFILLVAGLVRMF